MLAPAATAEMESALDENLAAKNQAFQPLPDLLPPVLIGLSPVL